LGKKAIEAYLLTSRINQSNLGSARERSALALSFHSTRIFQEVRALVSYHMKSSKRMQSLIRKFRCLSCESKGV
jgi:hypothetical protein